jgi:hypothetical protein
MVVRVTRPHRRYGARCGHDQRLPEGDSEGEDIGIAIGDVVRNSAGDHLHEGGGKPGHKRVEWREKLLHRLKHVQTIGLQTHQLGTWPLPTHQGM